MTTELTVIHTAVHASAGHTLRCLSRPSSGRQRGGGFHSTSRRSSRTCSRRLGIHEIVGSRPCHSSRRRRTVTTATTAAGTAPSTVTAAVSRSLMTVGWWVWCSALRHNTVSGSSSTRFCRIGHSIIRCGIFFRCGFWICRTSSHLWKDKRAQILTKAGVRIRSPRPQTGYRSVHFFQEEQTRARGTPMMNMVVVVVVLLIAHACLSLMSGVLDCLDFVLLFC